MTAIEPRPGTQMYFEATLSLPADAGASATAREVVAAHTDFLPDNVRQTAILLVSELASNAVLHGRSPVALRLVVSGESVRVEIHDHGEMTIPRSAATNSMPSTGRGLALVDSLSARWGVKATKTPHGKLVWFELVTSTPTPGKSQPW